MLQHTTSHLLTEQEHNTMTKVNHHGINSGIKVNCIRHHLPNLTDNLIKGRDAHVKYKALPVLTPTAEFLPSDAELTHIRFGEVTAAGHDCLLGVVADGAPSLPRYSDVHVTEEIDHREEVLVRLTVEHDVAANH